MLSQQPTIANMAPPTPHTHLGLAPIQQYTAQHYNQYPENKQTSPLRSPTGIRHHPYGQDGSDTGRNQKSPDIGRGLDNRSMTARSVRRRISRACDQCNQLRTKCDGKGPCAHCVGMSQSLSDCVWAILIKSRIRSVMRVRTRTKETRKSVPKERWTARICNRGFGGSFTTRYLI